MHGVNSKDSCSALSPDSHHEKPDAKALYMKVRLMMAREFAASFDNRQIATVKQQLRNFADRSMQLSRQIQGN